MLGAVVNLKVFGSVLDQFERMDDIDKGESRSLMVSKVATCVYQNLATAISDL